MKLDDDMKQLEVIVKFNAHSSQKYIWCDDIELSINYDLLERSVRRAGRFPY